jgi:hypothetical protein
VDHALAWFDAYSKAGLLFPKCADWEWLRSLDFDGVMNTLDLAERQNRGLTLSPDPTGDRPIVDAGSYCKNPADLGEGLFLVNHSGKPALDVRISAAHFGKYSLKFAGPNRLAKEDGNQFFSMENIGIALFNAIREWQECSENWAFHLPVRIVYRDFENKWYVTTVELEPDPGRGPVSANTDYANIEVKFVGQEYTTPPL